MPTPYQTACSTKAKREALYKRVVALAEKHGATIERRDYDPREIGARIVLGHFAVSTDFDGGCALTGFMAHWHMDRSWETEQRYPSDFGWTIGGSVNECHFRKATTFADSAEELFGYLEAGLTAIAALAPAGEPVAEAA